ncbi:MAG: diguanylate cyclase domain-containing protein [Kineosporiaceae bacterium]
MRRYRLDVLALLTAGALVVLGGFAAWAVISLSATTGEISRASARVVAYQDLQETVAAQAVAEAGYRRSPSPAARLRLDAAVADVTASVDRRRGVADPGEGAMLSYLLLQNDRYVTETERTLGLPPGAEPDDRVAGPALDAVQELVSAALGVNQEALDEAVDRQRSRVATLTVLLPAVMAVATGALVLGVRASRARARALAAAAEEAHRRSLRDALTGLANRAGFVAAFAEAMRHGPADTSVLLVDVDHFKQVNDTHGHGVGDAVLTALGARMRESLRPGDTLARLGGDEFAAVLPQCHDPRPAAERLRAAVAQPLEVQGVIVLPTVSVGVARHEGGEDVATVMRRADEALYRSKATGRDRVSESRPDPRHPALDG